MCLHNLCIIAIRKLKIDVVFQSGCSAVGSAPALGAGCRRFESCHSDHKSTVISIELRRTFSTPQNRLKQGIQAYNKPHHRVLLRKSDPATLNMAVEFFIIRWYN